MSLMDLSGQWIQRSILIVMVLAAQLPVPASALESTVPHLEPITVTAPGLAADQLDAPAAVSVVEGEDLQRARQRLALDESLNRVPGVFFQNRYNFAQNLRLSIRGFGARAPFGVRGVRLRVDGLPLTLPDGQSQVDTIDLETAEKVELLRGPSSALYGNAAGGVLDVQTRSGAGEPYVQGRVTGGSHGLRRVGVTGGGERGDWRGHASAWHLNVNGFRDQSATEKMMFNGKGRYQLGPGRSLSTVLTLFDQPKGEDPGGLTREEVRQDREQAAPFARQLDTQQSVNQQRFGLIYKDSRLLPGELSVTSFYSRRDFEQQLPFPGPSLIGFDRDFYGLSAEYRDSASIAQRPLNWILGASVREQRDDRERFLVDPEGNRGARIQDAVQTATSSAVYGQLELDPIRDLTIRAGGRFDRVRLDIDDNRGQGQASGSRTFNEFSVSAGPIWRYHRDHRVYATIGTAFETPTFTEFSDPTSPDEGFDPDLEPQEALNLEVGFKGRIAERARYELALFRIRTRDEIVQVSSEPDRFANAGETRRNGLELGVEYFASRTLTLTGAYTLSDFRFQGSQGDLGEDLDDNRLPGLPRHNLFLETAWRYNGWLAAIDAQFTGEVYADDANTERVSSYTVVNARMARTLALGDQELELSAGVNNLFDEDYFGNVRINATAGRFFEPAPGRNVHAGLRLRF